MRRALVLLALWSACPAAAAPAYTAAGIVNAGNYTSGPFAPNSILTLFGSGLARSTQSLSANDIAGGFLPVELNYTRVYVDNYPAPLFYVADGQINFMIPANQALGTARIRVAKEGVSGPEVSISIVAAAPALFTMAGGFAIATHADNSLITADSPALANEVIVIYATGLGKTVPNNATGAIAQYPAQIALLAELRVAIGSVLVSSDRVKYAGLSPGSAGLYQINLAVPDGLGADPQIRVTVAGESSPPDVKLPAR